ncbi:MAG: hypothetical protein HY885_14095 [Deltaproteobacteria bacterium]|nr:hypothetical protein [Deltaproteobacteria bacterium]
MLLLLFSCPPVAGEDGVVNVGGAQLDLNVLKDALREQVSEELEEALKSGREQLEGLPGAAADQTRQFLYGEFKRWVRVRIYQDLPEQQRLELATLKILPNDPGFDPYLEQWLKDKPDEAGLLANAYLLESSARKIMEDLESGASKEIIDGLSGLYEDAEEKLKRFTTAVEEAEEGKAPAAKALEKYGFSGPWLDKFKGREAQFRKLQEYNKKYNVLDSLQLLYEAFQADNMPRQKIGAMFGLLEKLGGAAGASRIPIVSFMGQMVENLGKIAAEMLAAEERLAKIISAREGNCLGADTHDVETPRQRAFNSQFEASIRICPTDLSPEIYVQEEPFDNSKVYFFVKGRFLVGNPAGGGLAGLRQVKQLLEMAAAANFIRYAGKTADPATLAAVYNTPYPPPGDEQFAEKEKRHGAGIPGVMNEAVAVLDGISSRLEAMEKLVSGQEEQCGVEKLHAFLKSATGLNAPEYHDAESRLADDLRLHYVMAYIDRYVADEAAGGGRTAAYDTYSRIWVKLEKLSLLRVAGRVAADGATACRDCAAAAVTGRVAGGGAQVLPVCTAGGVDRYGAFTAFYAMSAEEWALAFRAEAAGRRTPEETLNPKNSGVPQPPFITTTEVVLRLPQEKQAPPPKEENTAAGSPPDRSDEPPPAADGQSGMAGVVAEAIEKCDLDLAETLLAGVRNGAERSALEKALTERRRQHEESIKVIKQAEAEVLGEEPYRALSKLEEVQALAPCDRDRQLAKTVADRVRKLTKSIDDGRYTVWVEDALAECRFKDARDFINRISEGQRGELEARLEALRAGEEQAGLLLEEGRRLVAEGRIDEGLAVLRQARAATRCTRQAGGIDQAIAQAAQAPRTCDAIMKGGIFRREAGGAERCVCPDGQVANRAGSACVDKPEIQVAARQCADNAEAYWDAEREQARCRCKPGFRFSKEQNACLAGSDPELDKLLGDVAANQQESDAANQGERTAANDQRDKSQYADSGPASREREPQGPDLMGGLLQALGTAVAQSQGVHVPAPVVDQPSIPWPSGGDSEGGGQDWRNVPRQDTGQQGAGNQVSAEQRAEWQRSLDCLLEGKRLYPNYWQDCNGSFTMRDRDVEIRHLEELLGNSGGSPPSPAGTGGANARDGNDWFILASSEYPASHDDYRRFPECRFAVARSLMFIDSVAGGRREIEATADGLRAKGYASVEVIYANSIDSQRLVDQWHRREEQGRNACWDAKSRSEGGRR